MRRLFFIFAVVAAFAALLPTAVFAQEGEQPPQTIEISEGATVFVWPGGTLPVEEGFVNAPDRWRYSSWPPQQPERVVAILWHYDATEGYTFWRPADGSRRPSSTLRVLQNGETYVVWAQRAFALQVPPRLPLAALEAQEAAGIRIVPVGNPSARTLEGIGQGVLDLLREQPHRAAALAGVQVWVYSADAGDPAGWGHPLAVGLSNINVSPLVIGMYERNFIWNYANKWLAGYVVVIHELGHNFDLADDGLSNASICPGLESTASEECAETYSALIDPLLVYSPSWEYANR
ncbi:MAG: hypothetical protein HY458_02215 [Parcubacteria group bacterium]|nr:hypothetical protein [Parcubacteria group bacterium]